MLTVSPSVVEKGTENQDLTLTYTSAVDLAVESGVTYSLKITIPDGLILTDLSTTSGDGQVTGDGDEEEQLSVSKDKPSLGQILTGLLQLKRS